MNTRKIAINWIYTHHPTHKKKILKVICTGLSEINTMSSFTKTDCHTVRVCDYIIHLKPIDSFRIHDNYDGFLKSVLKI